MRRLLGGGLLSVPFVAWVTVSVVTLGVAATLAVVGVVAVVFALIWFGLGLLMED